MRKILMSIILFIPSFVYSQTHIEYISEKADSMALISNEDVNLINKVFEDRNKLDSLNVLNEKIILQLEYTGYLKDSIILKQSNVIRNNIDIVQDLEAKNNQYFKDLCAERNKKKSFQVLTGAGLIAIILLILI